MHRKTPDRTTTVTAREAAQALAFGPLLFQAARALRDQGVLAAVGERGPEGATAKEVCAAVDLSDYATRLLLEAGLVARMLRLRGERYALTQVGRLVLSDPMTRVNMDFVHDVCYRPGFHLEQALREGRPAGLVEFGTWDTIYHGLSELPDHVRASWFAFDHFYSDGAFETAAARVLATEPRAILDVGGNTGRFARLCCARDPRVRVTIADLPGQLAEVEADPDLRRLGDRVQTVACDVLDPDVRLPDGHDVIWMSQFLDCFSEEQVESIAARAAAVMGADTRLYVLETFWDRQSHDAARLSVVATSLYFCAAANGKSKLYHSARMIECLRRGGLEVEADVPCGYHTLLCCRRRSGAG